ncbi:MAG: hypothetical protein R3C15_00580 [Thermoleophilia bacterium]
MRLARRGAISTPVVPYPLAGVDRALADLAAGAVAGAGRRRPG